MHTASDCGKRETVRHKERTRRGERGRKRKKKEKHTQRDREREWDFGNQLSNERMHFAANSPLVISTRVSSAKRLANSHVTRFTQFEERERERGREGENKVECSRTEWNGKEKGETHMQASHQHLVWVSKVHIEAGKYSCGIN